MYLKDKQQTARTKENKQVLHKGKRELHKNKIAWLPSASQRNKYVKWQCPFFTTFHSAENGDLKMTLS